MGVLIGGPTDKRTKSRTLILFLPRDLKDQRKGYTLACFGPKSHYRESDGSCAHTRELLDRIGHWHAARTRVDGFGGQAVAS